MVDKRSTETHKQTFDQKHRRLAGHHRSYRSLWTHLRQGERGNQRARCLPCDKGCPVRSPAIEGTERNQPLLWHKLSWSLWSYHAAHSTGLPPSPLVVKTRLWERRSQECLLSVLYGNWPSQGLRRNEEEDFLARCPTQTPREGAIEWGCGFFRKLPPSLTEST